VSSRDALSATARRTIEARRAEQPERPLDILVEGVRAPGIAFDSASVRTAIERVDASASVRPLPLVNAVACALRPADILQLADDPAVARVTLDEPQHVELGG
jgi:hypothetical protein